MTKRKLIGASLCLLCSASWGGGSSEFGEAPKLKGARWFSLAELKQYTNNWSDDNMIGVGGYGKVYRGELPNGDLVAIKRATEGSMQGANEFKNEIELLSRVHHRNLVGLVGFCYEGGEQALIYEFMANGALDDHLKGIFIFLNGLNHRSVGSLNELFLWTVVLFSHQVRILIIWVGLVAFPKLSIEWRVSVLLFTVE